jgi:hypothetical protein
MNADFKRTYQQDMLIKQEKIYQEMQNAAKN